MGLQSASTSGNSSLALASSGRSEFQRHLHPSHPLPAAHSLHAIGRDRLVPLPRPRNHVALLHLRRQVSPVLRALRELQAPSLHQTIALMRKV